MINAKTQDETEFFTVPEIPGLTVRHFRDDSDYERMARVMTAGMDADGLEWARSPQEIREWFALWKNFDLHRDLVLVEVKGELVAFQSWRWFVEREGTYIHLHHGFVLPEWRHRGIGRAQLQNAERRLREIAAEHPAGASKFLEVFTGERQKGLIQLVGQEGYAPVRYFYEMVRPTLENIPETKLPEGVEVRPATPEQYRTIWNAVTEAFAEHWSEQAYDETDFQKLLANPNTQPALWQVAWAGDEVVGAIWNYVNVEQNEKYKRKRGQIDDIATVKGWRGRGIAQHLIARSLRMFREMGMTDSELSVDTENATGALRLYEHMGFERTKTFTAFRKRMS